MLESINLPSGQGPGLRTALDDDAYRGMLDHMNSVHPDWQGHMGSMHRGGGPGGMMGGWSGRGFGGMMGGWR